VNQVFQFVRFFERAACYGLRYSASDSICGSGRLGFWQASRVSSTARRSSNFMLVPRRGVTRSPRRRGRAASAGFRGQAPGRSAN
jgi:hypothetical protein